MGYTSVRKCILIEIRTKFNLIHEKEWTGDTISNICKRYDVSRKTYYLLACSLTAANTMRLPLCRFFLAVAQLQADEFVV